MLQTPVEFGTKFSLGSRLRQLVPVEASNTPGLRPTQGFWPAMNDFRKMTTLAMIVLLGAAGPGVAGAHGIWFAQRANQLALVYGIGADDLDMVRRLPKVVRVDGFDAAGQPVPTAIRVAGPLPLVESEGQAAFVSAVVDNGLWSKTADGKWHNKGRDEVPDAVRSEHTFKYAVRVQGPLAGKLPLLPGQTLQIVPVGEALPEHFGTPLRLQVFFDGKPVAGARVLADFLNDPDAAPVLTGADGTVTVFVRNQGLNVVAAIHDGPPSDPKKVEKSEHLATLSFVLPHLPE
jgi:hypothetical protein